MWYRSGIGRSCSSATGQRFLVQLSSDTLGRAEGHAGMYYHHRDLRYVSYAKVGPPPEAALDPYLARAYRWLGQYCGFFPQVWLSRSRSWITGFRSPGYRGETADDSVLFGFEAIQGFSLAYDFWCELLIPLGDAENLEQANRAVQDHLDSVASDPELRERPVSLSWQETRDVGAVLSEHLFVKHDQVVVPSLNLKSAKLVICRNERQKKSLRHMGFIEDRLVIRGPRR